MVDVDVVVLFSLLMLGGRGVNEGQAGRAQSDECGLIDGILVEL